MVAAHTTLFKTELQNFWILIFPIQIFHVLLVMVTDYNVTTTALTSPFVLEELISVDLYILRISVV